MAIDSDTVLRLLLKDRAKLLGYIRSIVRDEHVAEDVFQNVSIVAVNKREEIESREHFSGWIRQAARFEALHELRRRDIAPITLDSTLLDLLEGSWSKQDTSHSADLAEALRACLESLSPYAQQLVSLRYTSNMSGQKLADAVGRGLNTVYVALSRTHRVLADCMRRRLGEEGPANA